MSNENRFNVISTSYKYPIKPSKRRSYRTGNMSTSSDNETNEDLQLESDTSNDSLRDQSIHKRHQTPNRSLDTTTRSLNPNLSTSESTGSQRDFDRSPSHSRYHIQSPIHNSDTVPGNISLYIAAACIGIFAVIIITGCFSSISMFLKYSTENRPEPRICFEFSELQNEYPEQDSNLWRFFKVGVESVLNNKPTRPSVFMLVHSKGTDKSSLIRSIINVTQHCMGNDAKPLQLTHDQFYSFENDFGKAITTYHKLLEKSGIMLVENFHKIPPKVVQVFHTFCDSVNPLVKRSVIFLTMEIPLSETNHFKITKLAENSLINLWKDDLLDNIIDPLIARVTDTVLLLE